MVDLLLSVKPEFAKKILFGSKRFEFRKKIPLQNINTVYIYSSFPEKRIVGAFRIREIIQGTPEELWENCREEGGIDEDRFFTYFKGKSLGYSLLVDEVEPIDPPVDPKKTNEDFKPPQNFAYLSDIKDIGLNDKCLNQRF
jgi:predicted transcriptional regulator